MKSYGRAPHEYEAATVRLLKDEWTTPSGRRLTEYTVSCDLCGEVDNYSDEAAATAARDSHKCSTEPVMGAEPHDYY